MDMVPGGRFARPCVAAIAGALARVWVGSGESWREGRGCS